MLSENLSSQREREGDRSDPYQMDGCRQGKGQYSRSNKQYNPSWSSVKYIGTLNLSLRLKDMDKMNKSGIKNYKNMYKMNKSGIKNYFKFELMSNNKLYAWIYVK